jgi:hypothetical protein
LPGVPERKTEGAPRVPGERLQLHAYRRSPTTGRPASGVEGRRRCLAAVRARLTPLRPTLAR